MQTERETNGIRTDDLGINNFRGSPPEGFVVADKRIMAAWIRDLRVGVGLGLVSE